MPYLAQERHTTIGKGERGSRSAHRPKFWQSASKRVRGVPLPAGGREALKAALVSREIEFPYAHDLDGLLELCQSSGLSIPPALGGVDRLAPYGVHVRHGMSHAAGLDRDEALRWATAAIGWATGVIEGGTA